GALGVGGLVAEAVGDRRTLGEVLDAGGVERVGVLPVGGQLQRSEERRVGEDGGCGQRQDGSVVDVGVVGEHVAGDRGLVLGHAGCVIRGDRGVVDAVDGDGQVGGVAQGALGVGGLVAEAVGDRRALGQVLDAGGVERVGVLPVGGQLQ